MIISKIFFSFIYRHKLEQHYKGKLYKCHCGTFYKSNGELTFHQSRRHENNKVTCEVCKQILAHRHSFLNHWRRTHLKSHGPLGVKECIKKRRFHHLSSISFNYLHSIVFPFQPKSLDKLVLLSATSADLHFEAVAYV